MESLSNRSEYSDLLPLTAEFVLENVRMSWPEMLWGHEVGLVGWRTLKEFATAALETRPDDEELSGLANLAKEYANTAEEIARSLAARHPAEDATVIQKKWLYLLLKRLYEERSSVEDPFGLVEQIYADFDYPQELERFVRWMPSKEPVRTPQEGAARMERSWRAYLDKGAQQFGGKVSRYL